MKIALIVLTVSALAGVVYFSVRSGGSPDAPVTESYPEAAPRDPDEVPLPHEGENFIEEESDS